MAEKTKKAQIFKRDNTWWSKNWFYTVLIAVAVIGGVCAFLMVPFAVPQPFSKDDSISTLRQAVLVATGGVLAILTLWENRRKNDQEHTRQVHAERRSRYATAIEQLANEKAPIRLGGVYTLVKLIDEWLADEKTLPNEEERREEGQVIINSLCAYVRSPFELSSKTRLLSKDKVPENYEGGEQQFVKDQARIREEKELRLTILSAIKIRLNDGIIKYDDGTLKDVLKGSWSDFDYDFSNAIFFYPVEFNNSYFNGSSNFTRAIFIERAVFSATIFTWDTYFRRSVFNGRVDFFRSVFNGRADFSAATFTWNVYFNRATFTKRAIFSDATFTWNASFSGVTFTDRASFSGATFAREVHFISTIFTEYANFYGSTLVKANFSAATFTEDADFCEVTFTLNTRFNRATFTQVDFSAAIFTRGTDFSGAIFYDNPMFINFLGKAKFSYEYDKFDPKIYNFEASPESPYKIETEEKEYNGTKFTIPKGAILFDSEEPSEQKSNDDS